jgi:argininosuccinate lyase
MTRLWDRGETLDDEVLAYTAGDDPALDERLVPYDLRATGAHAALLHDSGFLGDADHAALQAAIQALADSHARGEWTIAPEEEDCHTAIENRLVGLAGDAGRAVHLGRSRNDQILAALRPWLKDALEDLAVAATAVSEVLDVLAAANDATAMPGYTHLQRAMPSTVALWAGAFAAEIRDDAEGLRLARRRADLNPLGSAAGYGVPVLTLDREHTTRSLGFARTHDPVTAVQLSRGKAEATALFEASLLAQDLGRLAADICLFATAEFGFVRLPASITTGSSMLPQKRNPDVFEIARGRTAEAFAALQEVLAITAKMPSGYHRDLQLLKRPLFRGLDGVRSTARVMARVVPQLSFDPGRLAAAMDASMDMAGRANRLARDAGIPFREAYRRVREDPEAGR